MSEPRYQVFVSSTFLDLKEERVGVTEQLLRLRAIPAGMELFGASGQPPWALIEATLKDTDYMVLILGGRYGSSTNDDPRSYTEREYDYAVEHGIPVLAFLHHDITKLAFDRVDSEAAVAEQRDAFWAKVRDGGRHTVDFWVDVSDLSAKVLAATSKAFRDQPRTGWVRADANRPTVDESPPTATTTDAGRRERAITVAVQAVTNLPFLRRDSNFQSGGADLSEEHIRRLTAIETAALPMVSLVADAARWDTGGSLNSFWTDLVSTLGTPPRVGGLTALIDLVRAPAVLVLAAAGVGACAGRRDDLLGLLLSPRIDVDDPYSDAEIPAVVGLGAGLLYKQGWAEERLGKYLKSALSNDSWQTSPLDRAWERWQYLVGVARVYYATTLKTSSPDGRPHLQIEDRPNLGPQPVAARRIRKEVADVGDSHPLLINGFCGGQAELFDVAAQTFGNRYGKWGHERDWDALPYQGGIQGGQLPSGPHYPGSRS